MFSAAVLPWLKATSQCSTRIWAPSWTTLSYSATSPAANTPGAEVCELCVDADPAALAELEPGAAREHDVRVHAGADHDRVGVELEPAAW